MAAAKLLVGALLSRKKKDPTDDAVKFSVHPSLGSPALLSRHVLGRKDRKRVEARNSCGQRSVLN